MNSEQYWRKREEEWLKKNQKTEKDYEKEISRIYEDMLAACQNEINAFYGRYADKEGITLAEAKKRVSEADIKAYERKAKKYVKAAARDRKANGGQTVFDGDYFSEEANEEMRLYNLTMKVNRLEMLKANIGLELVKGHDELEQLMAEILQGRTEDELERQAGILGETIKNNAKLANSIVNASFHNATFSDRIWLYQDLLKADIEKELKSGLIQGKSAHALARNLKKTFGVRTSDAERLMRTELARVQTDAQKKSFEKNGFELYRFICNVNPTKGNHTCPDCERLANTQTKYGKGVYLVKDMMPGTNAPPVHPQCRCSTAAYEDSEAYEEWLEFLANGGTTEEYNKKKNLEKSGKSSTMKLKLTDTDVKAVHDYMGAKSYVVNEKLRNDVELSEEEQEFVKNLDHALDKLPKYKGILQRSLYFETEEEVREFMKDYEVGKTVTCKGYTSTTKGAEMYNPDGQVQIYVQNSKNGIDISDINENEKEVLYKRDASFVPVNIVEADGKIFILVVER